MRKRIAMLTCHLPSEQPVVVLLVTIAMAVLAPSAAAQVSLGQILDAGAKLLSPDEFKQELVQRKIVGPTPTGGTIELLYAPGGNVVGTGLAPARFLPSDRKQGETDIRGEWKIGNNGAVCTVLRIVHQSSVPSMQMAPRCQYWFKSGDQYFLADSDIDREAKVLIRTIMR
jgi:hypothetical protein